MSMNILGICLSTGKGGLELYAHKAITALQHAGHVCHFALAPNSFLSQREWTATVIAMQPAIRQLPIRTARKLARYIDAHQIDIIHMHWNKDLPLVTLAKSLSRRKPKLVYTRHMEITRSKKDLYHRLLYRQVDLMLVIAKFVLDQALRYLPLRSQQIALLYLGVEASVPASTRECTELLSGLAGREPGCLIGMVGRIEPFKGQHVLIEAVALLKRQGLEAVVAMLGPIMDKAYFDKLIRQIQEQDLSARIKYLGVSQEPDKLMGCCDIVVLTTFCETFGLVLVEAMRAGTAVIGTNAGGVSEIIKHNETGMLFEPGDAQQLAGYLSELCRDTSKRQQMAKAGKAFADANFDERQHYRQLENVLAALL